MQPNMQKHIPSTSSLFVGPDESFGGDQCQNLVSRRFADIQLDHGDEPAVFLKPGHRSMPGENEFLHSTSFDSSDDEMLPSRLPKGVLELGNRALSENDSSDNTEIDGTEERKNLFEFIRCYKPRETELRTILRPFVPDYIPAVGAVDEFIKVPRPDGLPDYLGLKVLDESGSNQSDPAVITLQLRASTMQSSQSVEVATVENPEQNPKKVDAWIESMKSLHRLKLPSTVTFSKPMPDMETLIQALPTTTENAIIELQSTTDTTPSEMELTSFVDECCSFLGIPVYKSRVESLHCMFALFLDLKKKPLL